jgi:hypothetical protein
MSDGIIISHIEYNIEKDFSRLTINHLSVDLPRPYQQEEINSQNWNLLSKDKK